MRKLGTDWRATRAALRWFARDVDEQFRILRRSSEGADALVTSANEVTASTVAEYRRIPHFRVAYAPIIPGSHPPPLQPFQALPSVCNRLIWGAINASLYPLFGPPLSQLRDRIGLRPTRDLPGLFAARSHTLLAISPVLAPPRDDWRYPYSYVGYCFNNDEGPLDVELEAFLAAGPPPVYIGFGSVALGDAGRLTELVLQAVRRAGCRALIARGWFGLGGGSAAHLPRSEDAFGVGDTPHATLFPRCAAAIHHGAAARCTTRRAPACHSSRCPRSSTSTTGDTGSRSSASARPRSASRASRPTASRMRCARCWGRATRSGRGASRRTSRRTGASRRRWPRSPALVVPLARGRPRACASCDRLSSDSLGW